MNRINTPLKKLVFLVATLIIATTHSNAERDGGFVLPEIERKALLNGMQFLFFNGGYEQAPFILMIENGAAFDPAGRWGATYLMSRMMYERLSGPQWAGELASRSIQLEFRVGFDAIYFYGVAPESQMEFALTRLGEAVVNPDFSEEEFEDVRSRVLEEVRRDGATRQERTQHLFQERLFQENPYAHPVKGTAETLEGLYLRDVKIQAKRLLMPNQARLAVYYNGDRNQLFRVLSPRWGTWVRDEAAPFTFRQSSPLESASITIIDNPGAEEALLRCGFLGVPHNAREYLVLKILEQYLLLTLPEWAEQVGSTGQLRGSAELVARKMPGYFQMNFQASPQEVVAYFQKFEGLLDAMAQGQVDPGRFAEAKTLVYQEFLDSFQDPLKGARQVLETELYELGINYLTTFHLRLERISSELFVRIVKEVLSPDRYVMVVSGPAREFSSVLSSEGAVEILN